MHRCENVIIDCKEIEFECVDWLSMGSRGGMVWKH
jgi:hypothetical protein